MVSLTLCLYLYLYLIALSLPNRQITQSFVCFNCRDSSQQFLIVVELNERTRYGVKFLNENLIFCPLQDEPSSSQFPTWETQLHPEGNSGPSYDAVDSGPSYDAVDPNTKLQEGYYQNPSITIEQTILSDSKNLERIESFDSFNSSDLLYPKQSTNTSLIEDYPQPNYSQPSYSQPSYLSRLYTEQIDSFDSLFIQQDGEFDGFEFFYDLLYTCTDTTIVH